MVSNYKFLIIKANVAVFLFLLSLTSFASFAVKPLPTVVGGRVAIQDKNQYIYSWPGTYFESAFYGNSIDLHLNDSINMLNIVVDNKPPIVLNKPGKTNYSLNNLGEGLHKIRLEKRTESFSATATFEGFFIPQSQKEIVLEQPKRKIEFIGDSFTVGYGNTSTTRECSNEQAYLTTNTQLAFGPLVAKHFNAQYQINAVSGQGVVRNYKGSNPETSMVAKYPFVFNYGDRVYKSDWSPNIIVIILGINDFNSPLDTNEKWKTREALQSDFVMTYEKFVFSLRKNNPSASIFLISPEKAGSEVAIQISHVADRLREIGEKELLFKVPDITLNKTGCAWHASIEDHQNVANMFIEYMADSTAKCITQPV